METANRKTEEEDGLQIYIRQIKAYPLLTPEEEVVLSKQIKQGNEAALTRLINANLRLVVKIAHPFIAPDVPFLDIIQEGNIGLMFAAKKFDYAKNVRFSTYAGWWIRMYINRYLTNKRRIVRLPYRKEQILRRIQRTYHVLSQSLMHQPNSQDIASELGISVRDIDFIINLSSGPLPLETDVNQNGSAKALEIQVDYTYNPERNMLKQCYRDGTRRFLEKLKERERQVLYYRYRLEENEPFTLKEIAEKMELSTETVRQIELRALAKIRSNSEELKQFYYHEAM
ncbi:MAG: sigma-70 family RNA polymerase sigma factor [Treponema sp.]|nr:sigma-70 family RNA polymerase sigma factor [Treponema sp.]